MNDNSRLCNQLDVVPLTVLVQPIIPSPLRGYMQAASRGVAAMLTEGAVQIAVCPRQLALSLTHHSHTNTHLPYSGNIYGTLS